MPARCHAGVRTRWEKFRLSSGLPAEVQNTQVGGPLVGHQAGQRVSQHGREVHQPNLMVLGVADNQVGTDDAVDAAHGQPALEHVEVAHLQGVTSPERSPV